MKRNIKYIISVILIFAAAAALIVFEFVEINYTDDRTLNSLLSSIIPRLVTSVALVSVMIILGNTAVLKPKLKSLPRHLLWCIPCFLVAIANFPFTALINSSATINRSDLIALFVLECISIGLMEELLFRGLLQEMLFQLFEKKAHRQIITVIATSAVFGLIHILNLIAGANAGETFLQIGYSFLIGAMLSSVIFRTKNIWLCVIIHAAFDFGGNIVTELGSGYFQDVCFWIFTAVAGIICFAHVLYYLIKSDKLRQ